MMDGSIFFLNRTVLFRPAVCGDSRLPNTVAVETSRRCSQQWDLWPLPLRFMGNVVFNRQKRCGRSIGPQSDEGRHKFGFNVRILSLKREF